MEEQSDGQAPRRGSKDSTSSVSTRSPTDNSTPRKWENTSNCGLCDASLGKRHFNPRHHCRVCRLCVCASCSPSMVQLEGQPGLHRACKRCAASAVKDAQGVLRLRSRSCSSTSAGSSMKTSLSSTQPVEEAFGMCNQAIRDTNEECRRLKQSEECLTKQIEIARLHFLKLGQRIHHLSGHTSDYCWTSELRHTNLEEAAALCEKALDVFETKRQRGDMSRSHRRFEHPSALAREALLRPVFDSGNTSADPEHGEFLVTLPDRRRRCCSRESMRKALYRLLMCFTVTAVVICGSLIAFRFFHLPHLVQTGVNAATVSVTRIRFSDLHDTSGHLQASITLAAPLAGLETTVSSFNASLFVNGRKAAAFEVPQFHIPYGEVGTVNIDSQLFDVGETSLRSVASTLSSERHLEIRGQTSLTIFGQRIHFDISKPLQVTDAPILDVSARNLDILSGSALELHGSLDIEFYSSGILSIADLGPVIFTVHSPSMPTTELGVISVQNFGVTVGANLLKAAKVVLRKSERDSSTENELATVFGNWISGAAQKLTIRGPLIRRNASFVNAFGLVHEMTLALPGLASGVFKSALVNNFYSIRGHMPDSGKPCAPGKGDECFRGSLNLVETSISHDVRIKDMSYDVYLDEPLGYETTLHGLIHLPVKAVSCPRRREVASLFSAKGMWTVLDSSRAQDDFIILRGNVQDGANRTKKEITSFFLPGRPQPGQADGSACLSNKDYDCCFSTLLTAAACYYRGKGMSFIPARLKGNQTITFGDFSLHIQIALESLPIVFDDDVTSFRNGLASMTCDDFTFY